MNEGFGLRDPALQHLNVAFPFPHKRFSFVQLLRQVLAQVLSALPPEPPCLSAQIALVTKNRIHSPRQYAKTLEHPTVKKSNL